MHGLRTYIANDMKEHFLSFQLFQGDIWSLIFNTDLSLVAEEVEKYSLL